MIAREVIESYVFHHYGNLTTVGDIVYEDESGKWVAQLKSDYPRLITDDRGKAEEMLKFISMPKIGTITFDKDMNMLQATSRDECGQNIWDRLHLWRESAERIMVEASADQLADARGADQFMSPVQTILDNLQRPMGSKPIIYHADINDDDPQKWRKFLSLLGEIEIVNPIDEGWTYGPMFTALLEQSRTQGRDFFRVVLSYILQKRYAAVRDILHIGRFEKLIHLDNSYYSYALEAEEPVNTERNKLFARYRVQYGDDEAKDFTLNSSLQELGQVRALSLDGNYCYANEKILSQMITIKHKVAELGFPVA